MIDDDVDQVQILQAFPDYSWNALTERMCYHFGKVDGKPMSVNRKPRASPNGQTLTMQKRN